MALTVKNAQQEERAMNFVATCKGAGFSPSETVFLAEQHTMFNRGAVRSSRLGSAMLMDFFHGATMRISEKLTQIKTPAELAEYRNQWVETWIRGKGIKRQDAITLFGFVYKSNLMAQLEGWMDMSKPLNHVDIWEKAQIGVSTLMKRTELVGDTLITPVPLKQAMKQVGLHSLTWNKFLYPTLEDEQILGGFLVAFNEGLQAQTGLTGGVLGLGGALRLHLDDDTVVDHGGVFSNSIKMQNKTAGKNAFGSIQIRLPSNLGFNTLAHEWFHAFDCTVGDIHKHRMSSQMPGSVAADTVGQLATAVVHQPGEVDNAMTATLAYMRQHGSNFSNQAAALFEAFDQQVAMGDPDGGWAQWAQVHNAPEHHTDALRSLALLGAHATGSLPETGEHGGVAQSWLTLYPDLYQELPEEQLAYAFERGCLHTRNLPSSASYPLCAVRSCVPSERQHAYEILTGFFSNPDIKAQWEALNSAPETSPLLDAIAARRLAKRKTVPGIRAQRKAIS